MTTIHLSGRTVRFKRRGRAGFTLVELMVSLIMGLIVAMAAISLAKSATVTFHEQARSSTTEMSVRMASERLRQDLARVSYMSTGNIVLDPKVAVLANAINDAGANPALVARYPQTQELRGLRIDVNMQANEAGVPPSIAAANIKPDALELVGNYTTDDAYSGQINMGSAGGACVNGQTILLDPSEDAAVYSLAGINGGALDTDRFLANAQAAFMPVAGHSYLAQVTDAIGCTHYVPVCDVQKQGNKIGVSVAGRNNFRAVLYASSPSGEYESPPGVGRSCGATEGGRVTIAPLSRVRWQLVTTSTSLLPDPSLGETAKVDLVRIVLDFDGAPIGAPEVIAEYAVDLRFGIVFDDATDVDPTHLGGERLRIAEMDSDPGTGVIFKSTAGPNSVKPLNYGPQRVRSVRYRIAVRTGIADREADLPVDAGASLARLCVESATPCTKFARVRTIVSEVALTNQARMFY